LFPKAKTQTPGVINSNSSQSTNAQQVRQSAANIEPAQIEAGTTSEQ
jgi:hypothetical protein